MKSMTGFGSCSVNDASGRVFKAEMSSINRKQFELKISLPHEYARFEIPLRSFIQEKVSRGVVTMRLDVTSAPDASASVDFSKALAFYNAARAFQKENAIPGEITISDILARPDITASLAENEVDEKDFEYFRAAASGALENMLAMREREGASLEKDIMGRLAKMETLVGEVEPFALKLASEQTEHLKEKFRAYGLGDSDSDERLLKEAVIYGDKLDVNEELTRLHGHFEHFKLIVSKRNEAVGRSLDFLVQEIFRECNTLGNKAGCEEVSPRIVALKTELEKIREQIQNVE